LDTVLAQNWTVPVALTPKLLAFGAAEDDGPEDAHPAAPSSVITAAPVSTCLLNSFIASAFSR
jgi:hypothetical protein